MDNDLLKMSDMYILLVEGSAMQTKLIQKQFEQLDIVNIKTTDNARDALHMMIQDLPDLVISSLYLPDMTGSELVTSMRLNELLQDLPFMLISSETSFKALDAVRQSGVVAILPKPFNAQDLKRALATSLDFIKPDDIFWPGEEVWVFAKQNNRIVEIEGGLAIDPQQTSLPGNWRNYPAYYLKEGETLTFKEMKRGDPVPAPDQLSLQRMLWLRFDGSGYTIQDTISGKKTTGWRL